MGYTHGTLINAATRVCTKCKIEKPNTNEYFVYSNTLAGRLSSVCKDCDKIIEKQKRQRACKKFENVDPRAIVYSDTKQCKKCNRDLPNSYLYFPVDKGCKSGLRNVCRECSPSYGGFLSDEYVVPDKWTDEDIKLLKDNYANYTGKELQSLFFPARSIRAITSMANVLGVTYKTEAVKIRGHEIAAKAASIASKGKVVSEKTKQKISCARKEYYQTHESHWKGRIVSDEERQRISERAKGRWAGDKNPRCVNPLNGKMNGRWRGGVNLFHAEFRTRIDEWKKSSMEFCGYRCVVTGTWFDNIHHTTSFTDILVEALKNAKVQLKKTIGEYSDDELTLLEAEVSRLHKVYGYGACITESVHKLFHDTYSYTKFTPLDFAHFLNDINHGKYDDWFVSHHLNININQKYLEYINDIVKDDINESKDRQGNRTE